MQLSDPGADAGIPTLVSDPYGYVHAFWPETSLLDRRPTIQYSRFNGTQWTVPQDIYVGGVGEEIRAISASLSTDDILHLTWVGSLSGPIYYSTAQITQASAARNWSKPIRIDLPVYQAYLYPAPGGTLNLIYSVIVGNDRGIYYSRSEDQGLSWSASQPLDQIRPVNYSPQSFEVAISDSWEIHVVWWDKDFDSLGSDTGLVQYIHSLDGGKTWSQPFIIAGYNQETTALLGFATPLIALSDDKVMIMWAEGDYPYRKSRFSPDHGINWTSATSIQSFGELHGQASDSLTVDGQGRVHYFGDIRYPQGLYHAIWDRERWFTPSMIYNIQPDQSGQSTNTSIHAHYIKSAVRLGNQLVVTMMDPPDASQRRLFVISTVINDVPQDVALPTPTMQVPPTQKPTTPPTIQPTRTPVWTNDMQSTAPPIVQDTSPSTPVVFATIFTGILIIGMMAYRLRNLRK